jgi:hypothetical protein
LGQTQRLVQVAACFRQQERQVVHGRPIIRMRFQQVSVLCLSLVRIARFGQVHSQK